jgi:hypothetical protein
MTQTCATCRHWRPVDTGSYRTVNGGMCELTRTADSDKTYHRTLALAPKGNRLWTDPSFGCVQHDPRAEGELPPPVEKLAL